MVVFSRGMYLNSFGDYKGVRSKRYAEARRNAWTYGNVFDAHVITGSKLIVPVLMKAIPHI